MLPIHCQFAKRFDVGAIFQHNFAQAQRVLISFQQKEAHYFERNEKIVTLTKYFKHPCPCFHLILNKIRLNKTKTPWTFDRSGLPRVNIVYIAVTVQQKLNVLSKR